MLKSSEFNSAVPKFTNGNYASTPLDPTNIEEPTMQDYVRGVEPLETLPAQWWNWLCNQFTSRFNKLNTYVKNIFDELTQLLSLVNVTPDGTESTITTGQLKNAFKELYPTYVSDKLELGTTYVKQTTTVNGHDLSSNVTVSKSDVGLGNVPNVSTNDQTPTYTEASSLTALSSGEKLSTAFGKIAKAVSSLISHIANVSNPHNVTKAQVGLGNVVNTGDSATPTENGTDKFTNGGAYTLKKDLTDIAESLPTDAVLHYSFDEVPDYPDGTADVRILDGQTYQIEYGTYAFNNNTNATFNNDNGTLVCNINNGSIYLGGSYLDKLFKCVIEVTSLSGILSIHNGYQNVVQRITDTGIHEITIFNINSQTYRNIYIYCEGANYSCSFRVLKVYCGDSSYSTPIIDNANGEWNSISQKGTTAQGVSGKGFNIPALTSCAVKANFTLRPPYTQSLWLYIKPYSTSQYAIDGRKQGNDVNTDEGIVLLPNGGIETGSNNGGLASVATGVISPNVWQHIAISCENINGGNKYTFYKNGVKIKEQNTTTVNIGFGELTIGTRYYESQTVIDAKAEKTIDDLLIFDRALSETEVKALYYNKANTPKYFIGTDIPAQSGNIPFTTGGIYNLLTSLAPAFSTESNYFKGQLVSYNGTIYVCTDYKSAGDWDSSKFTEDLNNSILNTYQYMQDNLVHEIRRGWSYKEGEIVTLNNEQEVRPGITVKGPNLARLNSDYTIPSSGDIDYSKFDKARVFSSPLVTTECIYGNLVSVESVDVKDIELGCVLECTVYNRTNASKTVRIENTGTGTVYGTYAITISTSNSTAQTTLVKDINSYLASGDHYYDITLPADTLMYLRMMRIPAAIPSSRLVKIRKGTTYTTN